MNNLQELFGDRDLRREWKERIGSVNRPNISQLSYKIDSFKLNEVYKLSKGDIDGVAAPSHGLFEDDVIEYLFGNRLCAPDNYWPAIVTMPTNECIAAQKQIDKERGISWHEHQKNLSTKRRIKSLILLNADYDPVIDERHYTVLPDFFKNTYMETLLNMFKGPVCRTRFVRLRPNQTVPLHIDYNTKYNLKIHIPVITNTDSLVNFNDGSYHLSVGNAYAFNTGVPHWSTNGGDGERVHLIVCIDGQEDLQECLTD